eukprot:GILJ01015574.1.p1 GENE.GILJ01015574.1~~GILJ01015574.1.p1  ORF type:complete len:266 (+),score=26.52 GILJ01015574.1:1005-1802(+)
MEKLKLDRSIVMNGNEYPLFLDLIIQPDKEDESVKVHGFLTTSADYPVTPLVAALQAEDLSGFGFLSMILGMDRYNLIDKFPLEKPWCERSKKMPNIVMLDAFYVFMNKTPTFFNAALDEESQAFKGIGKVMLCTLFRFLQDEGAIKIRKTRLFLEASGWTTNKGRPGRSSAYERYRDWSEKDLLERLVERYSYAAAKYLYNKHLPDPDPSMSSSVLECLVRTEENDKLVQYYQSTYGLEIAQGGIAESTLMTCPLTTIVSNCQN